MLLVFSVTLVKHLCQLVAFYCSLCLFVLLAPFCYLCHGMGRFSFRHISLFFCFAWVSLSCGHGQGTLKVFIDEPHDSIVFDLTEYAMPASDIELADVVKANDRYYCLFVEKSRTHWEHRPDILMCYSSNKREPYQIPLPESGREPMGIFQRRDTLFLQIGYDGFEQKYYFLNKKDNTWKPFAASSSFIDNKYDDKDWAVRYVEHGEFGDAMWFIDKASPNEYAFVGLSGKVHRIDTTFYIVGRTRVFELMDPSIGFQCDSTTVYSNARDAVLLAHLFFEADYSLPVSISPVVKYDNEDDPDFIGVSDYAAADTLILGSFQADGRLHCLMDTPSSTVLARWDGYQMSVLHEFPKYVRLFCHTYADALLALGKSGEGRYDLYEIGKAGNTLLRLCYKHGLEPVEQDGFEALLSYILEHWGNLYYKDIVEVEKVLGAKESSKNRDSGRNNYPPRDAFAPNETYHIDVLTKKVKDELMMQSEYWISDSDSSIPAAFFEWENMGSYWQPSFDRKAKAREIASIITRLCGSGTTVAQTDRKQGYTEWSFESLTLRLYSNHNLRLVLFRSSTASGN